MPSVLEGGEKLKFMKITFCGGVIPFAIFPTASWLLAMKHQHSYMRHARDTYGTRYVSIIIIFFDGTLRIVIFINFKSFSMVRHSITSKV